MSSVKFGFKAQQIIDEGRIKQDDLDLLKIWLGNENFPKLTDEQIVLFLLSCENEQEATKATIKTYYSIRKKTPELFDNRKMSRDDLRQQMNRINLCVLPKRTDDGCAITYSKQFQTTYREVDLALYLMHLFMVLDSAVYDHPPTGLIALYDLEGMGLMYLTKLNLRLMRIYLQYLQEALPLRLKKIHFFNSSPLLHKVMYLIKPFLNVEVLDMLVFHEVNADLEKFHNEFIPKRCLPEELGGDLPSVEVLHEVNLQKLVEMQDFFDAEELQRHNVAFK